MQVWNVLHVLAGNTGCKNVAKKLPSAQHCTIYRAESSQLRHVLTIGKKLVKQQYLLQTSLQYAELQPLTADIDTGVWGTPANFNGFHVLASLLQWYRSPEANQTLHDVWPSPGLVFWYTIYIHFRGFFPPDRILPGAEITLHPSLVFFYIRSVTAGHSSSGLSQTLRRGTRMEVSNFRRGRHLYSSWQPLRWGISPHSSFCFIVSLGFLVHMLFCVRCNFFRTILSDWRGRTSQKHLFLADWVAKL